MEEVAILGGGVAATASAIALLNRGIRTRLFRRRHREIAMVEAFPASTMRFFDALDLRDLVESTTVLGRGIENNWNAGAPLLRDDAFLLVDRVEFATRLLDEAKRRGASVEEVRVTPPILWSYEGRPTIVAGQPRVFFAAVDASGRAAAWSLPVTRTRHMVADIFDAETRDSSKALRLVRWGDGWAYRICRRDRVTVARLAPSSAGPPRAFPDQLAANLKILEGRIRWVGRRVGFIQAATRVVRGRALAVGDAAFAHDPVSGQGLRFALASALAAAAVIRTWCQAAGDHELAAQFYHEFVATERRRHCGFLRSLYDAQFDFGAVLPDLPERAIKTPVAREKLPEQLRFCGSVEPTPLHMDGLIELGTAIRLEDGGSVRWLGGFDLLRLRDLARNPIDTPQLIGKMTAVGLSSAQALNIIKWCYGRGILG